MKYDEKSLDMLECTGINDVITLKDHIEAIFCKHDHQETVLIDLYRMVFPDCDNIRRIDGFPEAGNDLWKFICDLFIDFDRKHHPDCLKGGAWMNSGFSSNSKLGSWEISLDNCKVIMD
jgi:hypothetical protein